MRIILIMAALLLSACQTVTIRPAGGIKEKGEPDFAETQNFFAWGLVGKSHISIAQICKGKRPKQLQTQTTFVNALLNGVTFGIYAPYTAKVWCAKGEANNAAKKPAST